MLTTIELRWFYRGTLPLKIQDWFSTDALDAPLEKPEEREDFYLQIPDCESLGIKLRQDRLEIKWRQAELGVLQFGKNLAGKAEKWVKFTFEGSAAANLITGDIELKPHWVSVKKKRLQRKYPGCNVELTELFLQGNTWWSLAFEAFGEEVSLMANLQAAAKLVFETNCGLKLQIQDSYAYPQWLSLEI
jgi:hypothetical protein